MCVFQHRPSNFNRLKHMFILFFFRKIERMALRVFGLNIVKNNRNLLQNACKSRAPMPCYMVGTIVKSIDLTLFTVPNCETKRLHNLSGSGSICHRCDRPGCSGGCPEAKGEQGHAGVPEKSHRTRRVHEDPAPGVPDRKAAPGQHDGRRCGDVYPGGHRREIFGYENFKGLFYLIINYRRRYPICSLPDCTTKRPGRL